MKAIRYSPLALCLLTAFPAYAGLQDKIIPASKGWVLLGHPGVRPQSDSLAAELMCGGNFVLHSYQRRARPDSGLYNTWPFELHIECRNILTDYIRKVTEVPRWGYYCPSGFNLRIPSYSYPEIEQSTCVLKAQTVYPKPNAQPVANTCSTDTPITLTTAVKKFTEADYRSAFRLFRFERYYRSTGLTDDPSKRYAVHGQNVNRRRGRRHRST